MMIFTHIPRTAGTTVSQTIKRGIKKPGRLSSRDMLNIYYAYELEHKIPLNPAFLHGHLPYGIHRIFRQNQVFKYITFVREPVERFQSALYWLLNKKNVHQKLKNAFARKRPLAFLLKYDIMCNPMVKQLSGCVSTRNLKIKVAKRKLGQIFPLVLILRKPYNEEHMESMLEHSIQNLKCYEFVGLQKKTQKHVQGILRDSAVEAISELSVAI